MLRVLLHNIDPAVSRSTTIRRTLSSALYITGDKAKEQYAPLVPYLDFQSKLADLGKLESNLRLRRYRLDFEVLKQQWELYRSIELRKRSIEARRVELRDLIAKAVSEDEVKQLKMQATLAKEDLKSLKESSYAVADVFVAKNFLRIPNELHERTPADNGVVLFQNTTVKSKELASIGEECLEEHDSTRLYMTEDAALMDLFLPMSCVNVFQDAGFILFSNPDFVRSVLVEAAQVDLNSIYLVNEEVDLEHTLNRLHLCGGGSLLGFLGYFTKLLVFPNALPLRLVTVGNQYFNEKIQTRAVHILATAHHETEAIRIFDEAIELYKEFFDRLEIRYRLMLVSAHGLNPAEAMRVDVEVFSPKAKDFTKVGDLCYYSDFISKRIAFNYHEDKIQRFPHIVSGTVLGCVSMIKLLLQLGISFKDLNVK
ncbi:serine--tRNA synthetase-like protein Slimp [Topomyia yanbarensis]|uniref:serine--tRNA synthetase-like protein Slimp n=1 Tax=Topomyia yanbarensis TaxID=2498891 RepID=UPI00273AFE31|nr:serine--tRNA synthetase-like protein Slimp [Topomyia yanbarensis]